MKFKDNFFVFIIFLLLLLSILFVLSGTVYAELMNRFAFTESVLYISELNSKKVFSLDKILMFSSASASNNEVVNKALWDINVSQFTDIAIYINNNSEDELTAENTINSLYIDNIKFNNGPILGNYNLFYKNVNNFGKYEYLENNIIQDSLNFEIVQDSINYDSPSIYIDASTPICLSYVNKDIKTNAIISDTSIPLVYDGSLLKRSGVSLNNIRTNLSFNIHIINNLGQHFVCNTNIEIPLEDENSDIYSGYIKKELSNLSMYHFYRTK